MSTGAIIIEDRVRIPAEALDLDGFCEWAHSDAFPETGSISFIGGAIEIDMSPEELNTHTRVKRDVTYDLETVIRKLGIGELLVDGAFLVNEAADLATEPDLMFLSWKSIRAGRVGFEAWGEDSERPVEVRGTPDIVCEIVSRGSVSKDTIRLKKAYFEAGIPEYWLIDARGARLSFQILKRGRNRYAPVEADGGGYRRSVVVGRSFRLVQQKNQIGGICYRLRSR